MRKLSIIVGAIALLIAGFFFLKLAYPSYTYRQRMTVEVEVGSELRTGSSVIEITVRKQPKIGDSPTVSTHVRGEAVFVDLGGSRNVTALLASGPNADNGNYPEGIVSKLFGLSWEDRDLPKYARLQGRRSVTTQLLPTFVTFSDLDDPKSARVLRPNEFEQVFGPDVHFRGAWIEMTDAPVTSGIEQKMPWWNGPFPWLKPIGSGVYVDTRPLDSFRWGKEHFKRDF